MSKQVIAFRMSDHEIEILSKNLLPDESPSQCAARILREILGISKDSDSQLEIYTLNDFVSGQFELKIEGLKMWIEDYVNNLVNNLENRVEALEKSKPKTSRSTRST